MNYNHIFCEILVFFIFLQERFFHVYRKKVATEEIHQLVGNQQTGFVIITNDIVTSFLDEELLLLYSVGSMKKNWKEGATRGIYQICNP